MKRYKAQFRTVHFNMGKNKGLANEILSGSLRPDKLVTMSAADMLSPELKEKREAEMKAAFDAARCDWEDANRAAINKKCGRGDGGLKCGKCKSMNTTYYQQQTRSADEPMTNFCRCIDCGHRWRFC